MSRTIKSSKGCGYEYWGKRAGSGFNPGSESKKLVHRMERHRSKQAVQRGDDLPSREAF